MDDRTNEKARSVAGLLRVNRDAIVYPTPAPVCMRPLLFAPLTAARDRSRVADVDMARTRPDRRPDGKRRGCLRLQPCLLLACLVATPAFAQDGIRRCIGNNGEPVFSDRPCTPPPTRERTDDYGYALPAAPLTQTCATSPLDLRDRVAAAFDARNAIALSGLVLWDGHSRGDATNMLREFARLVDEPLIAIDVDRAATGYEDPRRSGSYPAADVMLNIRTARDLDHVPQEASTPFDLVDQRGCWWLQLTPAIVPDRRFD